LTLFRGFDLWALVEVDTLVVIDSLAGTSSIKSSTPHPKYAQSRSTLSVPVL